MPRARQDNPIVHIEELTRFPIRRRRRPPLGVVQVYSGREGALYCPEGGLTSGEQWWLSPRLVYEVDVAPHPVQFSVELVSPDGNLEADLGVEARWYTVAPITVVVAQVFDAPALVQKAVEDWLRADVQSEKWGQVHEFQARVNSRITNHLDLAEGIRVDSIRAMVRSISPVDHHTTVDSDV